MSEIKGYDAWKLQSPPEYGPRSDFDCPECGEELNEEDMCDNEECDSYGEEPALAESDSELRQEVEWTSKGSR